MTCFSLWRVMASALIGFLFLTRLASCFSAPLPPWQFVNDFLVHHRLLGLSVHTKSVGNRLEETQFQNFFRSTPLSIIASEDVMARFQFFPQLSERLTDLRLVSRDLIPSTYLTQKFKDCRVINCGYWMIDITGIGLEEVRATLDDLEMDIDDQVYLCEEMGNNDVNLYEAYKIRQSEPTSILKYGNWTVDGGLQVSNQEIWQRRSDLGGIQFQVATLLSAPYVTKMEPNNVTGSYEMEGMFAEVFYALQDIMNFTFVLRPPPDGEWGGDLGNGSWSGMVGMLQRGEIDIAATDFTVTKERSAVMTFAEPIAQIYHSLFIKNPQGRPNFKAYTEPLKGNAWVAIFIIIIVCSPILYVVIRFGGETDEQQNEFTLSKSYVFTTSVMTFMRPWNVAPSTFRGKLAYGSLLVGGTLTFYHWEAMLISYLATRVIVLPFNSLQELVDKTSYKITLTPGSSYMDAFKFSQDPLWQKAWKERIEPQVNTYPKGEGHALKVMAEPNFAMYDNFFAVETYSSYLNCEIIAIPERYDIKPYAYGFQKNSPFLGPFNYYLKLLREKGSTKQILEKYETRGQVCPDYSGKALGFESCFTAFLCLLSGFGLAVVLLVTEQASKFLIQVTGVGIPWIDSYGKIDVNVERKIILNSELVEDKSKLLILNQEKRIKELETTLNEMTMRRRVRPLGRFKEEETTYGFTSTFSR